MIIVGQGCCTTLVAGCDQLGMLGRLFTNIAERTEKVRVALAEEARPPE
jgi:hypothetical protein